MEPSSVPDIRTARFESIGVGAVEVDFEGLARSLGELHPGGVEQSHRLTGLIMILMGSFGHILPLLLKAQEEIMARQAADEPSVHAGEEDHATEE